jgi:hypothetical protein
MHSLMYIQAWKLERQWQTRDNFELWHIQVNEIELYVIPQRTKCLKSKSNSRVNYITL